MHKIKVAAIKESEHSWRISSPKRLKALVDVNNYSDYGLQSVGIRLNFPAKWINEALYPIEPALTEKIIENNPEIEHYISELAQLYHNVDTGKNEIIMLYDNEKFLDAEFLSDIEIKFKKAGITNPFQI